MSIRAALFSPAYGAIRSGGDMSMEAQISTAHQDLDAFAHGELPVQAPMTLTDRMHALLVARADALAGCPEGSPEETELAALADAIDAYEAVRWPPGRIPGDWGQERSQNVVGG